MSEQPGEVIPSWTVGDRLRKAREFAELSQDALAKAIGISRNSVVTYEASKARPKRPVAAAWSLRTGVSIRWIATGADDGPDPGPPTTEDWWAVWDSNPQPTDYLAPVVTLAA